MTTSLSPYFPALFIAGFGYFVLACQVNSGFPPFYRRRKLRELLGKSTYQKIVAAEDKDKKFGKLIMPPMIGFVVMVGLSALPDLRIFTAFASGCAIWGGIRVRQYLLNETGGPFPWISSLTIWTMKWPMLVFDIWTVGISLAVGCFIILIAQN